jgi:hypothetical protein
MAAKRHVFKLGLWARGVYHSPAGAGRGAGVPALAGIPHRSPRFNRPCELFSHGENVRPTRNLIRLPHLSPFVRHLILLADVIQRNQPLELTNLWPLRIIKEYSLPEVLEDLADNLARRSENCLLRWQKARYLTKQFPPKFLRNDAARPMIL